MKTLNEIKSILESNKEEIKGKFKVEEIGIFSSYIKGEARRKSDLDILVKFREPVGLFEPKLCMKDI